MTELKYLHVSTWINLRNNVRWKKFKNLRTVWYVRVTLKLNCIYCSWIYVCVRVKYIYGHEKHIRLWRLWLRAWTVTLPCLPVTQYFFFFFLGLSLWHMEVLRLGVELELQLPAYTTATATPDPSHICNLHHSSRQCQVLKPLGKARDRTRVLMDTSWVHYHWATMGIPI